MRDLFKRFANVFGRTDELKRKLKRLGVHRLELPTPFPQVSSVNVYLIEGTRPTLIDTGVATRESWVALKNKLDGWGYRPGDIKRILLTHGHVDHYGLAQKIIEESGADAYIHPKDKQKVIPELKQAVEEGYGLYSAYFEKIGVPKEMIEFMHQMSRSFEFVAQQIQKVNLLDDGEVFPAGELNLKAIPFPGHTPGMVCYYDERQKLLFSGDHILRRISPNPLLELSGDGSKKFKSLVEYLKSLDKLLALDINFVLPGHFSFIDNIETLITRLKRFYEIRQRRLLNIIEFSPMTPFKIMQRLFPNIIPAEIFLAISEVIANLEVLEEKGRINFVENNGALVCRKTQ